MKEKANNKKAPKKNTSVKPKKEKVTKEVKEEVVETKEEVIVEETKVLEKETKLKKEEKEKSPKKKKVLKIVLITLVVLILLGVGIYFYLETIGSNEYKLEKLGYKDKEVKTIISKTSQSNMDYLYKNGYVKIVPELVKGKTFKKKLFNTYVEYYEKYTDVTVEDLLIIVNNGADEYEYTEFLMNVLKSPDFKIENLDTYMSYSSENKEASYEDVVHLINMNIKNTHSDMLVMVSKEEYFIYERLERYINYFTKNPKLTSKQVVTNVNSDLDRAFYTNIVTTDINKNELVIVNKYYKLPNNFNHYGELVTMDMAYSNKYGQQLSRVAYDAFVKLVQDAEKEGYYIRNNSAFRSYNTQEYTYNGYVASNGQAWADSWSARAGHSEHQTGLALDVGKAGDYVLDNFEYTGEYKWMLKNAHKYGFILRYPKGKEYITGYNAEAWHYRYVGVDIATYIYEHNITYEEYYAYFLADY